MNEFAAELIAKIEPLSQAKIVFVGFTLPSSFGGSTELEFGNTDQSESLGLSPEALQMGKSFVKSTIEDLFSEDSELEETEFYMIEAGSTITVTAFEEE